MMDDYEDYKTNMIVFFKGWMVVILNKVCKSCLFSIFSSEM
jgi:hypothetical protein